MAETIEKRVDDLEQVLAHLPEDLDARFAGVDTKLAQIREVQALHTTRFSTLEQKLNQVAAATAEILRRLTEQS
jgi:oligoendopeptidase F